MVPLAAGTKLLNGEKMPEFAKFRSLTDEQWHQLIQRSVREPMIEGVRFPGFPPEELQRNFVGSANETTLHEAFAFFRHIQRWRAKLGITFTSTSKVLDFGTGWGRIIRYFLRDIEPRNLHGVDVDPDIVRIAADSGLPCQFSVVPALGPTEFPDETFDVVLAYSVFSHLTEVAATGWIKELARITKPGGLFIATTEARHFIDFCASLAGKDHEFSWHQLLSTAFPEPEEARRAYDAGEFVYAATGGGDHRDSSFYGDACVSKKYIVKHWCEDWKLLDFLDNKSRFWQVVFVMKRRQKERSWFSFWQ
jgi:ubiquinone/menaquinone biosynthesis C-methylase UbiE